jgi:addiction module RelE/StbE family toxin
MKVRYSPKFIRILKKIDVRIRNHFKQRILLFSKNPNNPQLHNHPLRDKWKGYRSINITNDWRAIYTEKAEDEEKVAYFIIIGTHKQLYK